MKRNILSVIIGLVAAVAIFTLAETINSSLHPAPADLNIEDPAAVKAFYQSQPLSLWLLVLSGWVLGSLACGFLIKLVSKSDRKQLPIIAGGLLTLSAVANFFLIPHPTWFVVTGLLVFIPSTLLGHTLYRSTPS
ncbi:MAG: hypothetical protein AAF544_12555 [Bacteroidota bacterium]